MPRGILELLSALFSRGQWTLGETPLAQEYCLVCNTHLVKEFLYTSYRICPQCKFHYSIPARERIELLVDEKSFKEKFRTISSLDPLSFKGKVPYKKRLFKDQRRTGLSEAAIVGQCKIDGQKIILVLLDFGFMGGSIGCVVGEKVALAFEYATKKRLPVVAIITSGGGRIQEGILSLMQMAKTTSAVNSHHQMGLPYITVLANPTTGQVYTSFANLADIILAETGALVGLQPLRLLQELAEAPLPTNAHTAESHLQRGMVDATIDRDRLRSALMNILPLVSRQRNQTRFLKSRRNQYKLHRKIEPWEAIERVRRPDRPSGLEYVSRMFSSFVEIRGDRVSGDDPAIISGIGNLEGCSVVVIGHQRLQNADGQFEDTYIQPEGFRIAKRAMDLAAKFNMPLITLIDTSGPSVFLEAEERGIGHAVASSMAQMSQLPVPIIAVIIGEGGREGALALSIADRILMLENAIYSPISPEGAASLMYRDLSRVQEAAGSLRLTAWDALDLEIVDGAIPEPQDGAHTDPDESAKLLQHFLIRTLAQLQGLSTQRLLKRRQRKFRNMGEYTSYFRVALSREVESLQSYVIEQAKRVRVRKPKRKKNEGKILTLPIGNNEGGPTDTALNKDITIIEE
ncbi:acetyl-CoA carboxylase carboxyl transferase subunit beta [SAR202 cluster bacterium AD-802-E10_MRT_200m]|nr:acetyl-CoA carboxylase carboxyl transferase subunit beta [SAR202 cluster bacterium AD-802-E10_MRT_200m]